MDTGPLSSRRKTAQADMAHETIKFRGKLVFVWMSLLQLCWRSPYTEALDMIDMNTPELTCSEGLQDCKVTEAPLYGTRLADQEGPVNITQVDLRAVLCCEWDEHCVPCLKVIISLTEVVEDLEELFHSKQQREASGHFMFQEALVKVCFSSPGSGDFCKALQFIFSRSNVATSTHEILLREKATFGAPVLVRVLAQLGEYRRNITIPSLEKVCSLNLESSRVKDCEGPNLQVVIDQKTEVVRLKLKDSEKQKTLMCLMMWDETPGEMIPMCEDRKEIVISLNSAAPCLCFQVWWQNNQLRRKYCPFKNQPVAMERMLHSVSLALMESARGGRSALLWNVSAPCRLKADVWLCKRDVVSGACLEVTGSRQNLDGQADWERRGHWIKTGEFNLSSHPQLCLRIQLDGVHSDLDPYCPFAVSRWRWIVLLLVALLLVFVSILGACRIQGAIKGFAWRCLKDDDVKGAVGGGHVVLLYPPDDEQALPGLMCHLGSSLQALGCSVSLDLWSHAELSVLGPVPWLHSRLDRLQRQGGKVVLVLTQAARRKAEEWGARSWERFSTNQKDTDSSSNSNCVDVFSASLSCILADYLQGRAGERFMLVQFESLPPEEEVCQPLPELFRGLHVYSLPSQSLGFLTELAGARQMAASSSRQKRAHGLRMASRALARGLSGFTAGTAVLRLAVMPQSCVGTGEKEEDAAETMPLQPYLITPPSSPDTNPKVSQMEWV